MKELQVLGIVRIGKEKMSNGKYNDYIELVEKFQWSLDDEFQNMIKNFDWDSLTTTETDAAADKKQPKPMRRIYPGSDMWQCDNCKIQGDFHFIRNHTLVCKKTQQQQQPEQQRQQVDKEQTLLS